MTILLRAMLSVLLGGCSTSGGTPGVEDASGAPKPDGATLQGRAGSTSEQLQDGHTVGNGEGSGAGSSPDAETVAPPRRTFVFVGGWDWGNPTSYPFRSYALDRSTGELTPVGTPVNLGPNPSYIAKSKDGRFLYVANERSDANGGVTTAEVDLETGVVTKRSHVTTNNDFVFTSLDADGSHVLASSYAGGTVSVFPIEADRTLGSAVCTLTLGGNPHSIRVDPSNRWAFVPNLGKNQVDQLTFHPGTGWLSANAAEPAFPTPSGSGPRHIALHPAAPFAFVMFESTPRVTAYRIAADGTLDELDSERTVPEGVTENKGAHVLVHPSGKFLYASNRVHQSIAAFAIDPAGFLTHLENEPSRGALPRHFDIDSQGELMVVANEGSTTTGTLAVFRIAKDGKLDPLGTPESGLPQSNAVAIVNVR